MRVLSLKILFIFLPLIFFSFFIKAQNNGEFILLGTVLENEAMKLGEVTITAYDERNEKVSSTLTSKKGNFELTLKMNSSYNIEFSKTDYVSEIISISTELTKNCTVKKWSHDIGTEVSLFKYVSGVDYSIYKRPCAYFQFTEKCSFQKDENFAKTIFAQRKKVKDDMNKVIKKPKENVKGRERMKSLFIYNFAKKYIEWPNQNLIDEFKIGILENDNLEKELKVVSDGKTILDKKVLVEKINSLSDISDLQILYVDDESNYNIEDILARIKGMNKNILIVTEGFDIENSMINFLSVDRKLKFELNKQLLVSEGFKVAPDLEKLAVNRQSFFPIEFQASEKSYEELYKEMEEQLKKEQMTISFQREELSKSKETISVLGKENEYKKSQLIEKGLLLSQREKEIENQIVTLRQLKEEIKSREVLVSEKQQQISRQDKILNKQLEDINKQKFIIYSTAGMFVFALGFVFFMVRANRQRRKALRIISAQKNAVEKSKRIIEEKNQDIVASIRYAQRIQETILPPAKIVKQYLENSFILFKPRDIVSGDFYWMETVGDKVMFAVVDCTGHGVPGAFVSIVGHNGLNRAVKEFSLTEPAKILDKLNEIVEEHFSKSETDIKDGMDISLCTLDFKNRKLEFAAANNSAYFVRNGEINEIKANKQPIGKYMKRIPFTNHIIEPLNGDTIYLFSDGYADQFGGPKGKKFKYSKFKEVIISIQKKSMSEQREILNETIDAWRGEIEQIDDICIIGVRI